jgi:translation initiation factor 2 beta subunit (eIF-2beta)/eIF-5
MLASMSEPEFLICLNCETPTYVFEYQEEKLVSVLCQACGNDDPSEFMTESELDEQRG